MSVKINLNPGARTVYPKTLNDIRGDINARDDAMGIYSNADVMAQQAGDYETQESATAKQKNLANFLGAIADASAGRGVSKTTMNPAQARGY